MNFATSGRPTSFVQRGAAVLCSALWLAGCGQEEIRVYKILKEKPPVETARTSPHEEPAEDVHYTVPAGWTEQPGTQMRVANFSIQGKDTEQAEVAVMPFSSLGGTDLDFVNLWRGQVGLAPIGEVELSKYMERVTVGEAAAKLFDVFGAEAASEAARKVRTLVAVLPRGGKTWFFKLAGDAALVAEQRPAFLDFLKSITFHEGDANAAHSSTAEPPPAAAGLPQWDVPGGWQEQPPTQMVLAKFLVTGDAGTKTEITVSSFPGDTGGLLANVNRWRGQIGLAGVGEAELAKLVTSLDASGGKATLVDMTGTSKATGKQVRLLGVIVPRGGSTWFYKMLGDESVAEREKAAFIKFVQTVRYPNV